MLLRALGQSDGNGSFGETNIFPSNARVDRALTLVEGFRDVYDKTLLKTKGKRSLANNLIWQSIRLPELKGPKRLRTWTAVAQRQSHQNSQSQRTVILRLRGKCLYMIQATMSCLKSQSLQSYANVNCVTCPTTQ